jgi:hypothetical protein
VPTPLSATPSSTAPSSAAPLVTPAQVLAGKYAISGVWTKVNARLIDETTLLPIKPGDPVGASQWTVSAACPAGKPCTATIVSSSGRRYAVRLIGGHWRGSSTPVTTACYDSNNKLRPGVHATMTIDVDIPDPSATLAKAPAKLAGTQLRHYDNGCQAGGTIAGTLVLTRR